VKSRFDLALILLASATLSSSASPQRRKPVQKPNLKLESKVAGLYRADDGDDTPLRLLVRLNHTFVEYGSGPVETPTTQETGTKGTWKMRGNLLILSGNESGLKYRFDGKNLLKRVQDDPNIELPNYIRINKPVQSSAPVETIAGTNLIIGNPKFVLFEPSKATYSVNGEEHTIQITQTGKQNWEVGLFWIHPASVSGQRLRLQFEMRSSTGGAVTINCQQAESPFELLGFTQTIVPKPVWQQYSFDFEPRAFGEPFVVPTFLLSSGTGTVSIRNVSLYKLVKR
jgi:hypothetical protein